MCINLADWDQFGFEIKLNYRKNNTYGTKLGGCCTLLAMFVFWMLFISVILSTCINPSFETSNYFSFRDYNMSNPDVNFSANGTLGVQLSDMHDEEDRKNLSRYLGIYFR